MTGHDTPPRRTSSAGQDGESPRPAVDDDRRPRRAEDRAQAFTLEGFIASVVVLTAILFALQAIVLTPTSGGQVDEEVRNNLGTQARDILRASAHNGSSDLSHHIRFFSNETNATWVGDSERLDRGYGENQPLSPRRTLLGTAMNQTFKQRGFSYNIQLEYLSATEANETETVPMVFRGVPTEEAVSVSCTVVLFDNETLTVPASKDPDCASKPIEEVIPNSPDFSGSGDCFYPIPEAELFDDDDNDMMGTDNRPQANANCTTNDAGCETDETDDSPIYNVVEVTVVIW